MDLEVTSPQWTAEGINTPVMHIEPNPWKKNQRCESWGFEFGEFRLLSLRRFLTRAKVELTQTEGFSGLRVQHNKNRKSFGNSYYVETQQPKQETATTFRLKQSASVERHGTAVLRSDFFVSPQSFHKQSCEGIYSSSPIMVGTHLYSLARQYRC